MASPDQVDRHHEEALELFDQAVRQERAGLSEESRKTFLMALDEETEAADVWAKIDGREPTRSLLYRSAAAIAMRAGEVAHAIVLCDVALASTTLPGGIEPDLREMRQLAEAELAQIAYNARPEAREDFVAGLRKKSAAEIERTTRNLSLTRLLEMDAVAAIWRDVYKNLSRQRGAPNDPAIKRQTLAKQASELPEGDAYLQSLDKLVGPGSRRRLWPDA